MNTTGSHKAYDKLWMVMMVKGSFHAHLLSFISLAVSSIPFHSIHFLSLFVTQIWKTRKLFQWGSLHSAHSLAYCYVMQAFCVKVQHTYIHSHSHWRAHTPKIKIIVDNTLAKNETPLADKWRENCIWNKSERTITGFRMKINMVRDRRNGTNRREKKTYEFTEADTETQKEKLARKITRILCIE